MANNKKIFISYSWTVQERVVELAERLIANGIDVVLDVYDLKEGQDKYAFMEQSVNDDTIDRVLIICDKTYAEKANNREGGVGDETVIISQEVYGQVKQEKFIPIIFEVDENNKAYCPHYIKSRIYIDLSTEDDRYETEYEKLLRNIYEKPLFKKPALGSQPEWLENDTVDLSALRDTVKQIRGYTGGNTAKADFLLRKGIEQFVEAAKSFEASDLDSLLPAIDSTNSHPRTMERQCMCILQNRQSANRLPSRYTFIFNCEKFWKIYLLAFPWILKINMPTLPKVHLHKAILLPILLKWNTISVPLKIISSSF